MSVPRLTPEVREQRRRRVLEAAWRCFSENGFHATSMDDVIAATGMSSSAVYRYVRSKDELIEEAARESLRDFAALLAGLLARPDVPTPTETIAAVAAELVRRTDRGGYDLTRITVQSWAESLRNPALAALAGEFHAVSRRRFVELAQRWAQAGLLTEGAEPATVAAVLEMLLPGMLIAHQLGSALDAAELARGLTALAPDTRVATAASA